MFGLFKKRGKTAPKQVDLNQGRKRARLVIGVFGLCFLAIGVRIGQLTVLGERADPIKTASVSKSTSLRPDIVDRTGLVMATDLRMWSLFANPRKILDVDEAIEELLTVFPKEDIAELRRRLTAKKGFIWLKRELSERVKNQVHDLGVPGFGFRSETKRIYPMGSVAAHVIGFADVDSQGLAGVEKFLDGRGRLYAASLSLPGKNTSTPVELSIDARAQHALTDELRKAVEYFSAKGAIGVIMDVHTGEMIAASSLPDFDPNDPKVALEKDRINRFSGGVFELGSVFKAVTFAMALDAGTSTLKSRYDARSPIYVGGSSIDDFHPQRRILTVPEVFTYSSNIGTAKMALGVGLAGHQAFLKKMGFFERLRTEVAEAAAPLKPRKWRRVSTMTASFGHGISVQPLQLLAAGAALMNGGKLIKPTFLKRDKAFADEIAVQVIRPETSRKMRYLYRLNVTKGTARKAKVEGYAVGGKTGTAEKVIGGRYSKQHRFNSFLGAFPMDDPRYAIIVSIDEPQPRKETHGYATSGWNAVPTAGKVIKRLAPILGVLPRKDPVTAESVLNNRSGG
ncbi:MAG: peptidoglycan D,D-transpeptidase FtsI family protein [Hyphomicrobiales bacterium]